jgi:hypothetical protein
MSENTNSNDASKKRGPSIKKLKHMGYLEILEHYTEYPQKNLKFNCIPATVSNLAEISSAIATGKNSSNAKFVNKLEKVKFMNEKDKADGWRQNYSYNKKFSKFLMTNLHFLPEHLWAKLIPFYHENVLVGYVVRDRNVHFFVHEAEIDNLSRKLYDAIKVPYLVDQDLVKSLVNEFESKDVEESWLTMRAKSLISV